MKFALLSVVTLSSCTPLQNVCRTDPSRDTAFQEVLMYKETLRSTSRPLSSAPRSSTLAGKNLCPEYLWSARYFPFYSVKLNRTTWKELATSAVNFSDGIVFSNWTYIRLSHVLWTVADRLYCSTTLQCFSTTSPFFAPFFCVSWPVHLSERRLHLGRSILKAQKHLLWRSCCHLSPYSAQALFLYSIVSDAYEPLLLHWVFFMNPSLARSLSPPSSEKCLQPSNLVTCKRNSRAW